MRLALSVGDELRHEAARHVARPGHGHLQVEAVGEAPHYLAHFVAGEHFHLGTFICHFMCFLLVWELSELKIEN